MRAPLTGLLVLTSLAACRPHGNDRSLTLDAEGATATDPLASAKAFRGVLSAYAGSGGSPYLTLPPLPALAKAPEADSPAGFFQALHDTFAAQAPGGLLTAESAPVGADPESTPDVLAANPPTIVIFPGFSSEFIDNRAFEEVLSRDSSSFHKEWVAALAAHAGQPEATDQHYDLTKLGQVDTPLGDLVHAASVDDGSGKPLVRLMLLHTPPFSLESLGGTEDEAQVMLRRLDKAFTVLAPQAGVAFLGYSRGTPLALDALAHATDRPWLPSVKAMISLGGVTYGSDVADDIDKDGSPANKELAALATLADALKPVDDLSTAQKFLQFNRNTAAWGSFLAALATADPSLSVTSLPNRVKGTDVTSGFGTLWRFYTNFGLTNPFGDYSNNIRRFQMLAKALMNGARSLTTADRTHWFQTHTLPVEGITYLSITATMADPESGAPEQAFMANAGTFSPDSPDDRFLLDGYKGMIQSSGGIKLNDSQMVIFKSRFWPEAAPLFNPAQAPMKVRWLGVLGTHHWGLALQVVNKPSDGRLNPYPRVALLEALAREVAR